jgi:hypothetical protein
MYKSQYKDTKTLKKKLAKEVSNLATDPKEKDMKYLIKKLKE